MCFALTSGSVSLPFNTRLGGAEEVIEASSKVDMNRKRDIETIVESSWARQARDRGRLAVLPMCIRFIHSAGYVVECTIHKSVLFIEIASTCAQWI